MRAQRYGALVVARSVGGLRDTVHDDETGFVFDEYTPAAFDDAVDRAVARYRDPGTWQRMVSAAMKQDFGWAQSAERYASVYDLATVHAQARA
jgi:starch synthase